MTTAKNVLDAMAGYASQQYTNGSADKPVRLAVVDPAYAGAPALPKVYFEGESDLSERTYAYTSPVTANQRVALLPVGTTYLIIGAIGGPAAVAPDFTYNPETGGVKRKLVQTNRSNTATLADDPELFVPVVAGAAYKFSVSVFYQSQTTTDIKFMLTGPTGATARYSFNALSAAGGTAGYGDDQYGAFDLGVTISSSGIGATMVNSTFEGILVNPSSAGNFTVQWAQATAGAATSVFTSSFIQMLRISP